MKKRAIFPGGAPFPDNKRVRDEKMNRIIILILFAGGLFWHILCMPVSAADPLTVRVGIYENSPKIFTGENGAPSGFWPDIVNYIFNIL
jgi:hypothetical protein